MIDAHEQLENLKVLLDAFVIHLRGAAQEASNLGDRFYWNVLRERAADLAGIRSAVAWIDSKDGTIVWNTVRALGDCAWSSVRFACNDLLAYEARTRAIAAERSRQ